MVILRLVVMGLVCWGLTTTVRAERPNVLLIMADDMGYGDVGCLNPESKIPTPYLDALAREGIVFTDAHSASSVCTPTRYALLTGRYNWRTRLKSGVLGGISPSLIEPETKTLADIFQQQGYATACIGKWHLGLDWQARDDQPLTDNIERGPDGWRVDYSQPFQRGPNTVGFDYFFGISASLDMVPYTYLENDRVTVLPTTDKSFPMMVGRKPNQTTRPGPAAEAFEAERVLPDLIDKSMDWLDRWSSARGDTSQPFFLYLPLAAPHTPIVPSSQWLGRSGLNPYADFVMQVDAEVGRLLDHLVQLGVREETLVIFTSDNGCSPQADFVELGMHGHDPSYGLRGHKADIFDGGHRVPFIVRWPNGLPAATRCDALVGLQDTLATCCDILDIDKPQTVGVDSFSWLPRVTKGNRDWPIRESLVHHSINGSFAIRRGRWKLCNCPDSGGWSEPRPGSPAAEQLPQVQLFDLEVDLAETNNLATKHPAIVQALLKELESLME
jgi:arylsulfatase A